MNPQEPGDFLLFQMVNGTRDEILAKHRFYVEQVRARLLSQFNDMETEAAAAVIRGGAVDRGKPDVKFASGNAP